MEPQIELHLLSDRLKIMSVKKSSIHKLAFSIFKIAFTNKTNCKYFSFSETNDDYTIITDKDGLIEMEPFIDETCMEINNSNWIPMILCGEDLPGAMSITKMSKYVIVPLANSRISILAISMYQCDYILIQEKDYDGVICYLSDHIPKIYDETLSSENQLVFQRVNGKKTFSNKRHQLLKKNSSFTKNTTMEEHIDITLPLIISDKNEYCITGLYDQDAFLLIIPSLIDIMFYESENYENDQIFFNFIKKESDISIVMETRLLKKFPPDALVSIDNSYWNMIRIGEESVGIDIFGVCASISDPLEKANIDEYYISSYHTGYCFIPANTLHLAQKIFENKKAVIATFSQNSIEDNHSRNSDSNGDFDAESHKPDLNNKPIDIQIIGNNQICTNLL